MTIAQALVASAKKAGWSPAKIAGEVGVAEVSVRRWLRGEREPRAAQYRALLEKLPGFADMVAPAQKAPA